MVQDKRLGYVALAASLGPTEQPVSVPLTDLEPVAKASELAPPACSGTASISSEREMEGGANSRHPGFRRSRSGASPPCCVGPSDPARTTLGRQRVLPAADVPASPAVRRVAPRRCLHLETNWPAANALPGELLAGQPAAHPHDRGRQDVP
jgi:hypothetical protein